MEPGTCVMLPTFRPIRDGRVMMMDVRYYRHYVRWDGRVIANTCATDILSR